MKKKVIAAIVSLSMILQPLSLAGAAEPGFTDGEAGVKFSDSVADEIAEEDSIKDVFEEVTQTDNLAATEHLDTDIQIGNDVWVRFDGGNATIFGTGATWDYYENGWDLLNKNKNPFYGNKMNKINIKDGITEIGAYLLRGSAPEVVLIGNDVKRIGEKAFFFGNFTEINLPEKLEILGEDCFGGCEKLKRIELPKNLKQIGIKCFSGCWELKEVIINSNYITEIPDWCFVECPLNNITFPESIIRIGNHAFDTRQMLSITLPPYLEEIGLYAFEDCGLNSVVIPATVTQVGNGAFSGCKNLQSVEFKGNGLIYLPDGIFYECDNLISVVIPNGIKSIGDRAFNECKRLQEIIIPQSVENIADEVFKNCKDLLIKGYTGSCAERYANEKGITFHSIGNVETTYQVGDNIIAAIDGTTLTLTGSGATYDFGTAEHGEWCDDKIRSSIETVIVGNGITRLGNRFLERIQNAKRVNLPDTLESIGCYTFKNCESLEEIHLPNSIINIEYLAFSGCNSLKEVVLPNGLTNLGTYVFAGCNSIMRIVFPSTLERIPMLTEDMQDNLINLSEVTIPEGVKTIEQHAFVGCINLESIDLPESVESIEQSAFWGCEKLNSIVLPSNITNIGGSAFAETGFTSFTWPETLSIIPERVFLGCTNLTKFSVPDKVTDINDNAFSGCINLEEVTIPETVTYFGNNVFYNCRKLTIHGYKDSKAERYADINDIPFVSANFKVVFKNNGRTVDTQLVMAGADAAPPALTKEGYTLSWDADYTDIQEDMIINAVWTKNEQVTPTPTPQPPIIVYPPEDTKYTVTFKDRGKIVKTEKVISGEAADYPYIQRNGYELTWDKDFSKVTGNMTVNAIWTVIIPAKVTSFTAEVQPKTIRLSWDETEYTGYYQIYRKAKGDKAYTAIGKTVNILWTDRKAKSGVEYQYKVKAIRSVDGKKYVGEGSDVVTAKIGAPEVGKVYTVGKLNYKVMSANQVRVTGAAKPVASLSIPTAVSISGKSFKVTEIDHKAFYKNTDIIDVKIGNNITYIGQYSFYRCSNLETVKFGKNVQTISTCAFTECPKLGNVTLPENVKRLGAKAFYHCPKLKILTVNTQKLEYIGKKGLAIDKKTVIKVPNKKYAVYKKMIEKSIKFAATKIVKM